MNDPYFLLINYYFFHRFFFDSILHCYSFVAEKSDDTKLVFNRIKSQQNGSKSGTLTKKSSKKRKHFLRVHDKKIVALGLMALMQSPEANNQNLLNEQSLMHLMKHLVSLLEDLRQQIESEDSRYQDSIKTYLENAAKSRENDVYEQYSRHRDDEDFEEDEDADEMTPQMRYQQALDRVKASGSAEPLEFDQSKFEEQDFSDSDSEGFAEDDEGSQSPLDDIDAFITFGELFHTPVGTSVDKEASIFGANF